MHGRTFLHKLLGSVIHKSRLNLLITMVDALIEAKRMTLTGLGRALKRPIQERSAIRTVDRFLKNVFFQQENVIVYKAISMLVLEKETRPKIIVDWSKIPNAQENVLRAAVVASGRSITIYEEVHKAKKLGNAAVQNKFLKKLKTLLPPEYKPILITDAGFSITWFKTVLKLGWDFVGRVRKLDRITYSKDGEIFVKGRELEKKSTATPKALGEMILSKANPLTTSFYVVKKKIKGRKKRNRDGKIATDRDSKEYSRGHRETWILVSSIPANSSLIAKRIVNIYSHRMTIEEGFRDLKSSQYGFGMEQNKTLKRARLIVWLMLAAVASLLAWIMGYYAEMNKLQYQFQANSIKKRRVLSLFYLGCQIIRRKIKIFINFSTINFPEEGILA